MKDKKGGIIAPLDPSVVRIADNAKKAAAFDCLIMLITEKKLLTDQLKRERKSRAKDVAMKMVALQAQISELDLLIERTALQYRAG